MGNQQSKSTPPADGASAQDKMLVERLRALQRSGSDCNGIRETDDTGRRQPTTAPASSTISEKKVTAAGGGGFQRKPEGVSVSQMEQWQSRILKEPRYQLALSAFNTRSIKDVVTSRSARIADQQVFNTKIPFEGAPITNQRSSGRCWLFASTNVFRVALMKRYNLAEFQLSQAYLFFWDKLEKSNFFLEQMIDTAIEEDLDGRLVQALLGDIASDGGQWDMVYNLVEKYGLVPQTLYPDSYAAQNSSGINAMVKTKLREGGLRLRRMVRGEDGHDTASAADVSAAKEEIMCEIHRILTLTLGAPPSPTEAFTWTYADKNGVAHELTITPRAFARDISSPDFRISSNAIASMVSLVHDPRHEPLTLLSVDRLGNVVGGRGVTYINVDMDTLKAACVAMIRAGLPVFFGSDVGQSSRSDDGIMDLELFGYESAFGIADMVDGLSKADRLRTRESQMTHAMVLTAVHIDEKAGKSVRWRVQNSWGTDAGDKGWFVMTDAWMDQFVYQAVIDPRFLSKNVRDVLKQEPKVLPLWDPMGSLAR